MGKEWDRLAARETRERTGFDPQAAHIGPAKPTEKDNPWASERESYGAPKRMPKCGKCGKWRYNGWKPRECSCPDPEWVVDTSTYPRKMQDWHEAWAREALRVLKPGGHLLAFGGTRTYHRLACAVEDAGFEIRDTICWMYGSGFPKSLDVGKQIDKTLACPACGGTGWKANGSDAHEGTSASTDGVVDATPARLVCPQCDGTGCATRQIVRTERRPFTETAGGGFKGDRTFPTDDDGYALNVVTAPATPEAEQWDGWGTALAPAHEPIVVARKPLGRTVAANVLRWGTGALNIDGSRVNSAQSPGRWPKNVVLNPEAARLLDEQTGELPGMAVSNLRRGATTGQSIGYKGQGPQDAGLVGYGDSGGASRFFYVAKASSAERNAGLDGFEERDAQPYNERPSGGLRKTLPRPGRSTEAAPRANVHPTVKPIDLMRWLVRLVTPPGGTVLDPFTGSGTTGCAAVLEGFDFIGIERDPDYIEIARARIAWWAEHPEGMALVKRLEADQERKAKVDAGQLGLFEEASRASR